MLVQTGLVLWFWTAALISVLAGWPGLALVLVVDLFFAWQLGYGATGLMAAMAAGAGALSAAALLARQYAPDGELVAAAGLAVVFGLVTKPILGLASASLLALLLSRHRSCRTLLLAFLAPVLRFTTAVTLGIWLLLGAR